MIAIQHSYTSLHTINWMSMAQNILATRVNLFSAYHLHSLHSSSSILQLRLHGSESLSVYMISAMLKVHYAATTMNATIVKKTLRFLGEIYLTFDLCLKLM